MAELSPGFSNLWTIVNASSRAGLVFSPEPSCPRDISGLPPEDLRHLEHVNVEYRGMQPVVQGLHAGNNLAGKEVPDLCNIV